MSLSNPYESLFDRFEELLKQMAKAQPNRFVPVRKNLDKDNTRTVLIFSPHPDDECIIGALPLRLQHECGMTVTNIAVTLGSRRDRRLERWRELEQACAFLRFRLRSTAENGLEHINVANRQQNPKGWAAAVAKIVEIFVSEQPDIIFIPHDDDWNETHIGTNHLVIDALRQLSQTFSCHVFETEFWRAMAEPNLLIESSADDVIDLATALSFHVGEVARNSYHLRLPAWMIDNVRRGSELVGGQGSTAPNITFATLYRQRKWRGGRLHDISPPQRVFLTTDALADLIV